MKSTVTDIKREKKTALFFREISTLIQMLSQDEPSLTKVYVNRVKLSDDGGICFVYFSTYKDKKDFDEVFDLLKLYKPSIRKALAKSIPGRYTANLVFLYDETKEKERKINDLLDQVIQENSKIKE